ncbi:MAG: efflux RND transporter periplasmic adaptor subunit [Hyphomicrobiaceae bacterium]
MDQKVTSDGRAEITAMLDSAQRQRSGGRARRYLLWSIAALAIAGGLIVWNMGGTVSSVRYSEVPVRQGDLTVIVTATGSVEPTNKVEVSSELSGTVRKVMVDYNSAVRTGQVLAELDTDKLKATAEAARAHVASAEASVVVAEATLKETERDYDRKRGLAAKRLVSTQDLDAALAAKERAAANVVAARAAVQSAKADLNVALTNVEKAQILSPIDGVVLVRNVDPGQTVASSLQAPVLFEIAENLKQMELLVDVDEADVGRVASDQQATFTVDTYADRKFPARVREVRYASEVVQNVVTYKAVLAIDNSQLLLRPGMTATAEIRVEEVKDVLLVPNAALRYAPPAAASSDKRSLLQMILPGPPRMRRTERAATPKDGKRQVYVLRDGAPVAVEVETGATDGRFTEVKGGALKAGDEVITDQTTATR